MNDGWRYGQEVLHELNKTIDEANYWTWAARAWQPEHDVATAADTAADVA